MGVKERIRTIGRRVESTARIGIVAFPLLTLTGDAVNSDPPKAPNRLTSVAFALDPVTPSTTAAPQLPRDHVPHADMETALTASIPWDSKPIQESEPVQEEVVYESQSVQALPEIQTIIDQLPTYGLEVTQDPYPDIDGSTIFAVSADGNCHADIVVHDVPGPDINIGGGRVMSNEYAADRIVPSELEVHAEGPVAEGKRFVLPAESALAADDLEVREALTFIRDTITLPLCDLRAQLEAEAPDESSS